MSIKKTKDGCASKPKKRSRKLPPEVREYMAKIGARGGEAGAGTPIRREIARKAAFARWRMHHPKPKVISEKEIISVASSPAMHEPEVQEE
jgi:hypothetical protein